MLHALLTGRPPGDEVSLPAAVPAGVAELCRRCLAADPAERPTSASEVAAALRALGREP